MADEFKRHIAYKLKIGDILGGNIIMEGDRLKFVQINNNNVARVNIIANVIDKYIQDEEKKFASITLDDASGQIKIKAFGEDIEKLKNFEQGDTVLTIGLIRQWNNEVYLIPEIIKKKDTAHLLLRKLETDLEKPKEVGKSELLDLKEKMINIIKREEPNGGASIQAIIDELKLSNDLIKQEIKKLLEEGMIYEPRPGKVRYLG